MNRKALAALVVALVPTGVFVFRFARASMAETRRVAEMNARTSLLDPSALQVQTRVLEKTTGASRVVEYSILNRSTRSLWLRTLDGQPCLTWCMESGDSWRPFELDDMPRRPDLGARELRPGDTVGGSLRFRNADLPAATARCRLLVSTFQSREDALADGGREMLHPADPVSVSR